MKHNLNKHKRRFATQTKRGVAVVLALLLSVLSTLYLPLTISAADYIGTGNISKIDSELLLRFDASDDPSETYQVHVWLQSISDSAIDAELKKTHGLELQAYENDEIYTTQTLPAFEAELAQAFSEQAVKTPMDVALSAELSEISAINTNATQTTSSLAQVLQAKNEVFGMVDQLTIEQYVEKGKSLLDLYELANLKNFTQCRRESVKTKIEEQNAQFFNKLQGASYTLMQVSDYVAHIILETTERTIRYISTFSEVSSIAMYKDATLVSYGDSQETLSAEAIVSAQEQMSLQSSGYTGSGVVVGVVEKLKATKNSDGEIISYQEGFESALPQFTGAQAEWINFTGSGTDNGSQEHASVVCSLIVGQSCVVDGKNFVGVAPNAQLIGISAHNEQTFYDALDTLIARGVNVINLSIGAEEETTDENGDIVVSQKYHQMDLYVDQIIVQHHVSVVVAAGNINTDRDGDGVLDTFLNSPSHAYNAIVVGNAAPLASDPPYCISSTSSYDQSAATWAANKPDISALGKNIMCPTGLNSVSYFNGTSYAAPFVAGAIACMLEAKPALMTREMQTKAVLLAAADFHSISNINGNTLVSDNSFIRTKSGVGLLDVAMACSLAADGAYRGTSLDLTYSQVAGEIATFSRPQLKLTAGQKVRVVMCFSIITNEALTTSYGTNLDLYLLKGSTILARSNSGRNNVEVIEFVVDETIQYKARVELVYFTQLASAAQYMQVGVSYRVVS